MKLVWHGLAPLSLPLQYCGHPKETRAALRSNVSFDQPRSAGRVGGRCDQQRDEQFNWQPLVEPLNGGFNTGF